MPESSHERDELRAEYARSGAADYTAWLEEHLLAARARAPRPTPGPETPRQRARREFAKRTMTDDLAALAGALAAREEEKRGDGGV